MAVAVEVGLDGPDIVREVLHPELAGMAAERAADEREVPRAAQINAVAAGEVEDLVERGGGRFGDVLVAEHVVAGAALQHIGAEAAEDEVRARAAGDRVVPVAAEDAERAAV